MGKNLLYLECESGISGDMTVAALLDLGADRQVLLDALNSLPLSGYSIEIKDVYKSGIRACDFNVVLDAAHENHDHDMAYLHGSDPAALSHHSHTHDSSDCPSLIHDDSHDHSPIHDSSELSDHMQEDPHHHDHNHGEAHSHTSRNLQDIIGIIRAGRLSANAAELAIRIFEILAKAEASVHGKSIDEVHFHEVGAVDSIVDIVAAAVCLDNLHPEEIVVSALTEGCGQIRCQHGLIPVPVPAVSAIAVQEGLVLKLTDTQGELVTPTGAAIAAAVHTRETLPEQFRIRKIGVGAGKRDYATAGVLRAMWLEDTSKEKRSEATHSEATHSESALSESAYSEAPRSESTKCFMQTISDDCEDQDSILVLETNIDDCTGEALAFTMQQLLSAGALDVFYVPIYMKKNRPACLLKTICRPNDRETLEAIIFQNTTTIGIRRQKMQRTKLSREIIRLDTPWGIADIKCCDYENTLRYFPENDSVSRLALENKIGFPEMYRLLQDYACKHAAPFDPSRQ